MKSGAQLVITCLAATVAATFATMSGQYSVNIHFVPPLVQGTCNIAQFWNPPNVTCALCFCMTGTLSRCIPQPGCVPSNSTNNATTTAPTAETTTPATGGGQQPTTVVSTVTPTGAPTQPPPGPTPPPQGETTLPPALSLNLIRRRRTPFKKVPIYDDNDYEIKEQLLQ